MQQNKRNLILVGMPGSGKSTLGVLAAKALNLKFVDTDLLLQRQSGKLLFQIQEEIGNVGFLQREADVLSSLNDQDACIATGGSAIYAQDAIEKLRETGVVVYLALSYDTMQQRIADIQTRGVVIEAGKTLQDIYAERVPLYERHADVCVCVDGISVEEGVARVVRAYRTACENNR